MLDVYNRELRKLIYRKAIIKLTQEEINSYPRPVSSVSHHEVMKPGSVMTSIRIVSNSSLVNVKAGISPNDCMQGVPKVLSSLLEVAIVFQ